MPSLTIHVAALPRIDVGADNHRNLTIPQSQDNIEPFLAAPSNLSPIFSCRIQRSPLWLTMEIGSQLEIHSQNGGLRVLLVSHEAVHRLCLVSENLTIDLITWFYNIRRDQ